MPLGLENIKGMEGIGNIDVQSLLTGFGQIVLIIFAFAFVAGIVAIVLWRKKQKTEYNKKIFWFEEVNGNMVPVGEDWACEMIIPRSNISVFYIKSKNLYMPRPTKRMGKNAYWYCIKNNREIVNFIMKNLNEEMVEANLDYDHTDMRYALANLKELIQRNYRDKSIPWWKEYKGTIVIVIYVFVLTISMYFLLSKMGGMIDQIGGLLRLSEGVVQTACSPGSGIVAT